MDARLISPRLGAPLATPAIEPVPVALRVALILSVFASAGAAYTTPNFVVHAPTDEFAKQVGELAEHYRDEIAMDWLGRKLPRWYKPCPIHVKVGQIGAGGATTFCFDRGEVFGWKMNIQGCEERILDSVLPHEVSHTIFASHFRRPLPRWADEGAATLVEHESERRRQEILLNQVINTNQRIPLKQLLSMKEYPREMQQVLTLYAEGHSLANFLVQKGGKARFLKFLDDAHQRNWDSAIASHYGFKDTGSLEGTWNAWIVAGSPPLETAPGTQLAASEKRRSADPQAIVRSQSPDDDDSRTAPHSAPLAGRDSPAAYPEVVSLPGRNESDSRSELLASSPRRPRPAPLGGRIAASPSRAPRLPNDTRPTTEPRFERGIGAFQDDPAGVSAGFARRLVSGGPNAHERDDESTVLPAVPEDAAEADVRSPDRTATPQADSDTGAVP